MPLNLKLLQEVLSTFGISTVSWGAGQAKTVESLLVEINEGECHLRVDDQGISRIVTVIVMLIRDVFSQRGHLLVETTQVLHDGRERQRNQCPSGKIKREESPEQCLVREIREKLKLEKESYVFSALPVKWENRKSTSYPGLPCSYIIYPFEVRLKLGCPMLNQETFSVVQEDGTKQIFRWGNPP